MSMAGAFGTLAFSNPWILAGLVFLPALWFLLRVIPPPPRRISFPAARFAAGLDSAERTASKTPLWILLLRMAVLALILAALARPVLNPGDALPGSGPVRIVIDNGWAAAQSWTAQIDQAHRLVTAAGRDRRSVYIVTTAPDPGAEAPALYGPLAQGQAESVLRGLRPRPWPAGYAAAAALLEKEGRPGESPQSYILSHGLKDGDPAPLVSVLKKQGGLVALYGPEKAALPLLLRPAPDSAGALSVLLSGARDMVPGVPVTVDALAADGRILDSRKLTADFAEKSAAVTFDLPGALRNRVSQIRLSGRKGAGAVLLLDDRFGRRAVGIAAAKGEGEGDEAALTDETIYIRRALEPYADVSVAPLADLLKQKPAMIVLANVGAMPPADLNALKAWVEEGGLLLRFAGPNMTGGDNFLIPVPLMKGGRALDGALTWADPVRIAPFPESSPLYGLDVPDDVKVRRQMLAQPVEGLDEKTWARLADGTPLMTADGMGKGLIVLVHTTATPQWSDLALSGLFVQMLRRIVDMAGSGPPPAHAEGFFRPLLLLDGFGATEQPAGHVRPVPAAAFEKLVPGPFDPPGLYGRGGYRRAINLGDRIGALESLSLPGTPSAVYDGAAETDLMPWVLLVALALFLCDWAASVALRAGPPHLPFSLPRPAHAVALAALCCLLSASPAAAQDTADRIAYAGNIYLAYVESGSPAVDAVARKGLESLAAVLAERTSVEPSGVAAVDPERTEMAFFPFLYWPVAQEAKPLSAQAVRNVQYYLDHGGTILFDTRDALTAVRTPAGEGGRNASVLRALTGGLDIPPLVPAKKDHVLSKSFYLLDSYPGRYDTGTLWVEEQSASGHDGVSSVIVGGNDWASAWADWRGGGTRREEMAMRFGVNAVLYALTGNYKADQVHLPHILERLGQ